MSAAKSTSIDKPPQGAPRPASEAAGDEPLVIAGRTLRSRLLLGTGGFASLEMMAAAIEASGS